MPRSTPAPMPRHTMPANMTASTRATSSKASAQSGRRPRIGVDFHTFDGIFQGSRSHLLGIYREAVQLAPELDFVFLLGEPERLRQQEPMFGAPNVQMVAMPHRSGLLRLAWQLAQAQRRERLDLLHVQYRLPFVPLGDCACTVHDVLFETHPQFFSASFARMARWTGRHAARQSKLLFTVSDYSRQQMARLYDLAPERIAITGNAVDTQRFYPGEDGAELVRQRGLQPGNYLCTVGRIEPRKNHLTLLRAYARVRAQAGAGADTPPLVVIGQRDFDDAVVFEEMQRLGLQDHVLFLQDVNDRELPALIRHARVFAYPSLAEGFGMPVLEAMACGVPVVTSNTTSLPEVAGNAALTVDPLDEAALAAALKQLIDQPATCAELVQRGLVQAARYQWHGAAQVLVQSYRQHFGLLSSERAVHAPAGAPGAWAHTART
jgi:glycosyltransferase involved in cell wall biosynthesis